MNIAEQFWTASRKYPDAIALSFQGQDVTYHELSEKIIQSIASLKKQSLKKGEKVLVFVPMSIELYSIVLALLSMGCVVVFLDEWSGFSRIKKALSVVTVDAIIAPRKYLWLAHILNPFRKIKKKLKISFFSKHSDFEIEQVNDDDSALITFTTGSTGLPKAADRTHGFLFNQLKVLKEEIDAQPGDVCLVTLPIVLLSILSTGATGIIADFNQKKPEKMNASRVIALIQNRKVTHIISSPFFLALLYVNLDTTLLNVKRIITGGAPVFPDMAQHISSIFPNAKSIVAYGSTEAEPIATIDMDSLRSWKSKLMEGLPVGPIHPAAEVNIIKIRNGNVQNKELNNLILAEGKIGEIIVSGKHVLDRYYNSDDAFLRNKIVDGNKTWHRTGDSGFIRDGQLFLTGRCDQLIDTEDGWISIFMIEHQLLQLASIRYGTLIKKEDKIVLVAEMVNGKSNSDLVMELERINIPFDTVKIISKMPMDPRHHGKIDYGSLY